jgi:Lrp/AsnC family transcriptional regulator, regulator for asnA, asnC and gidA
MIDETSFKIIIELCLGGRSSNVKIAKKLGGSVLTVAKRINTMIEDGVIAIKAVPNPIKMGYQANAFIGLDVDLKSIDSVCTQLVNNPHISMVVNCFGRYDVLLNADFRDWEALDIFIREDLPHIKGVTGIETYLVSESRKRFQGMFPTDREEHETGLIDEIDQKLIQELIKDGRPSYADLAKKLKISTSTISRRIAYLVKEDVIKIMAIPNPSKLGYLANAFVVVKAELSKVDMICKRLTKFPEVHLVMRLMNGFDIVFGVHASSSDNLYDFLKNNIASIDGVLNSETFIRGNFLYFSAGAMFLPSINQFKN